MMKKQITSFLLALLLLLSLAGCKQKAQPASSAPDDALPELVLLPDSPEENVAPPPDDPVPDTPDEKTLDEAGSYTSKDDVALYLHLYGHLPGNFITKKEAEALGWPGGSLEPYAPGKCIGGGRFGNYEKQLPDAEGRRWYECDVDTLGAKNRGAKRIVYSSDGLIYYTEDHYQSFTLLYGEE